MENGWTNIVRDIYAKKTRKYVPDSPTRKVRNPNQSIKDSPKTNLTTRKQFMKPNDSQNNGGIAQSEDTPSESGSDKPVNKTKDRLRNELIFHALETGHLERRHE